MRRAPRYMNRGRSSHASHWQICQKSVGLFESGRFDRFLKKVRESFDYIILDAPPVPRFPECRVLCTKADGVILVLEAGNVRRHVALRAKRTLEEAGARLLGVVLNRRKYYIPEWIYNRL